MIAILLSVGLSILDIALVNTALPAIAANVKATPAESVWIVNAYQLAMMATLLPFAALGSIVGQRRVYLVGLTIFVVASLACAVADSLPALTAARVLQGLGGSAVMSVNTALIKAISPPGRLGRSIGLNTLVVGVAYAVGPTMASIILSIASWPCLFAINVPLGAIAIVIAWTTLPQTVSGKHHFDFVAAFLNVIAFASLIFALGEAAQGGSVAYTVSASVVAVGAGILLIRKEAGHPAPILPVDLFARREFSLSAAAAALAYAAQGLAFVSLPFFLETIQHRSQVEAGFILTPWPVFVALAAPIAGRLADRSRPAILSGSGLLALGAGLACLALLPASSSGLEMGVFLSLCGAGFGFFQSPNLKSIMTSAPAERSGGASAIIAASRLLGQSTGAALVALCFSTSGARGSIVALALGAVFAVLAAMCSWGRLLTR